MCCSKVQKSFMLVSFGYKFYKQITLHWVSLRYFARFLGRAKSSFPWLVCKFPRLPNSNKIHEKNKRKKFRNFNFIKLWKSDIINLQQKKFWQNECRRPFRSWKGNYIYQPSDSILNKLALVSPPSARAISDYLLAVWRN